MSTTVGEHADPTAARPAGAEERLCGVDQLAWRTDAIDPGGSAGRVDRRAVGRERAGVRTDRARRRLAALHREHDHGRSRSDGVGRGTRERPPVTEVLDVERDQLRSGVRGEILNQRGAVKIGLVAERREAGKAESFGGGEYAELEREVSAL